MIPRYPRNLFFKIPSLEMQIYQLKMLFPFDQGRVCANPCPPGTYGVHCKERCDCYNGALCDHVNGKCRCLPGFEGTKVRRLQSMLIY